MKRRSIARGNIFEVKGKEADGGGLVRKGGFVEQLLKGEKKRGGGKKEGKSSGGGKEKIGKGMHVYSGKRGGAFKEGKATEYFGKEMKSGDHGGAAV